MLRDVALIIQITENMRFVEHGDASGRRRMYRIERGAGETLHYIERRSMLVEGEAVLN